MRILYIADMHSPIAVNWISYFAANCPDIHVISSYPAPAAIMPGVPIHTIPLVFSRQRQATAPRRGANGENAPPTFRARLHAQARGTRSMRFASTVTALVGPLEIRRHVAEGRRLIEMIQPDLVHAMRIPYEGIFAARAVPPAIPLLLSTWGNDLTLHAPKNRLISQETRRSLRRADALHADCQRDIQLAAQWGFDRANPWTVLPGSGGVHLDVFHPGPASRRVTRDWAIPDGARVVINPRGIRGYVRTMESLQAFREVLRDIPDAYLICTGMAGHGETESLLRRLGITDRVRLGPVVSHVDMANLFRAAEVTISPSTHDGTPNSLLEAMACGCFPIAGNIESVREWIDDGENGLLFDATQPSAIAAAMIRALKDDDLRTRAQMHNVELIQERASFPEVMQRATAFYDQILGSSTLTACASASRSSAT